MNPKRREKGVTKAKKLFKIWDATQYFTEDFPSYSEGFEQGHAWSKCIVHTRKRCSCCMCGNPRKFWNEKTMQEKKADISFREQLDDAA
jgi:hypothetical protein